MHTVDDRDKTIEELQGKIDELQSQIDKIHENRRLEDEQKKIASKHRLQAEYFRRIDNTPTNQTRIVNTRLVRVEEEKAWRERGGVIIEIHRPGLEPETEREAEWMRQILPHIDASILNDGTPGALHNRLIQWLDRWGENALRPIRECGQPADQLAEQLAGM